MKKTSALLIFFFSIQISFGQINLVGTLPGTFLKHYEFNIAGNKLVDYSDDGETITIYNYDGSIYKTIIVPPPNVLFGNQFSGYLSEALFDTDPADLEYLQYIQAPGGGPNGAYYLRVYDENGNTLFSADSVSTIGYSGSESFSPVYMDDSTAYMLVQDWPYDNNSHSYIYSLPGKLNNPCCCDQSVATGGIEEEDRSSGNFSLFSFPNPTQSSVKVFYEFPDGINCGNLVFYDLNGAEVKSFEVSDLFNYILVSTESLPSGTYLYRIVTSKGISEGKKQVVIGEKD